MTSILKVMFYVGVFILLQILKCMIQHRHTILLTPLCWKKIFWSRNSNEIGFALSKSSIFDSLKVFSASGTTTVQTFHTFREQIKVCYVSETDKTIVAHY